MLQVSNRRSITLSLCLAAGLAAAAPAMGQSWLSAVNGNWSDGTKWSGGASPNSSTTTATLGLGAPYTVSIDGGYTVGNLALLNPAALLQINNNQSLYIGNAAPFDVTSNNGVVLVNTTGGGNLSSLVLNTSHTFTGSGRITLNANSANVDTARVIRNAPDPIFTNASGHTVNGTGQFNDINVVNAGLVDANVAGSYLQFFSRSVANSGTLRASAGILQFNSDTINQSGSGQILATGSGLVNFVNCAVNGGLVSSTGGGLSQLPLSVGATFDGVTVAGPFTVSRNSLLAVGAGGMTLNGAMTVNHDAGGNLTSIRIDPDGPATIAGSGSIILNASPANVDTARFVRNAANSSLVIGPSLTVRGTGQFNDIATTNNGVINADVDSRYIQFYSRSITNNNLITATNGGIFQANNCTINNAPNGRVVADGPNTLVNYFNCAVNGGQISAINGGLSQLPLSVGATFDNVTVSGPFLVSRNSTLSFLSNGMVLNGTMTVNHDAGGNLTSLRADADNTPIIGTGTIVLNACPCNLDTARFIRNTNSASFVLGSRITVRGNGQFNDINITNNGVVNADAAGNIIQIYNRTFTNNNLLTATGGGTLQPNTTTIVNVGQGRIVADGAGSITNLINSTVSGGLISAVNGGLTQLPLSVGVTLDGVTVTGPFTVGRNSLLAVTSNGLVLNGTMTVNNDAGGNLTSLRANADNTLISGAGTIVLNACPCNLDTARFIRDTDTASFVLGSGITVRGNGQFNDINITNNGVVNADAAGNIIQIYNRTFTNNNLLTATGGGTLQPNTTTIVNVGQGRIVADGAGSITNIINSAISGGTISAINGGLTQLPLSVGATLNGVTVTGPFTVGRNSLLAVGAAGIVNNGILTINNDAGGNITSLRAEADSTLIDGTGTIVLNACTCNLDTARFVRNTATASFVLGPAQTLAGLGNINDIALESRGTIAPGTPNAMSFGQINFVNRPLTLAPTSIYRAQIGGSPASGNYDRLTGNSPFTLDGALVVTLANGYTPVRGDRFDIILMGARTGRFASVVLPTSPNGVWKYAYLPNGVRVGFACNPADPAGLGGTLGPDGGFTPDDLIVFLDGFFNGDLAIADVAGLGGTVGSDGRLTVDDIIVFLAAFFAGCPQ